ncbi:uncharacterized protein [Rutidosis leptorrhynchoides]|uniref:uncharacterized protein n=1 Tax=Rutidosis leptorrhynchoides TaxID=125765 RepID=UPI003A997A66
MIMFPTHHQQNLFKNNSLGGYGASSSCGYYDCLINNLISEEIVGGSDIMADDESRTEISNSNIDQQDVTATSSVKDIIIHQETINKNDDDDNNDRGWLQLRLGSDHAIHSNRPSSNHDLSLVPRRIEFDLLTTTGCSASSSSTGGGGDGGGESETWSLTLTTPSQQQSNLQVPNFEASGFFLQPRIDSVPSLAFTYHQQYENNYMPFRPYPLTTLSSPSTFSPSLEHLPLAPGRSLYFHDYVPPIRMDFRVVDPPRRPRSGVWFVLQASQNQIREPYLPQVPKSYLRIKDGRTTVRILIKYLVKKLKLHSEYEIEITCKGQQLLPFLTLQHVRDHIWNRTRNDIVFPHCSATVDHLMVLNYGRIA